MPQSFNSPLLLTAISETSVKMEPMSLFQMDTSQIILDTIKKAEDHNNCIILRFYEVKSVSLFVIESVVCLCDEKTHNGRYSCKVLSSLDVE